MITKNGKGVFLTGSMSPTREADYSFTPLDELAYRGWNTLIHHVAGDKEDIEFLDEAAYAGINIIFSIHNLVYSQDKSAIESKVRLVKDHPALLGYYIFDEPENVYAAGCPAGVAIKEHILERLSWVKPLLRSLDANPEHYIFMTSADWNFYKLLAPLFDYNIPNEYPTFNTKSEFEGDPAVIAKDASYAKDAGRFIYMPFAANIDSDMQGSRPPSINEFMYSVFSPITYGAEGLLFWCGYRSNPPFTTDVVYPVMKKLREISAFLTAERLKLNIMPSCVSAILFSSSAGRLLLAVNNSPGPVNAELSPASGRLPRLVRDAWTGQRFIVCKNVLKITIPPYRVLACKY